MSRLAPPLHAENYMDVLELQKAPDQFIPFYKNILKKADSKQAEDFLANQEVANLVRTRGWYVEQVLIQLWHRFITNDKLSLIAVGGFGRGDLHPYSDVDILVLKTRQSKKDDEQISQFIQSLWDIGLDIGSSVRTAKECYEQAKDDVTIATNLMEARFILGHSANFTKMQRLVSAKKIWKGEDFFIAKWNEQKYRHKKYSDTTYNVEPNIKEGPGGLRDIQMVSWVVQRFFQTNSLHELVDNDFLTEYEYIRLKNGQDFLWKVRFALHIIAGHKEERVLFVYQLKLAKIFGFHDEGIKNPAVEQFMQIFYRNAMRLERLNSRLLQLFDEKILKEKHKDAIIELNPRFQIVNDFLEIKDENLFSHEPTVWFELFLLIQKHPEIQGVRANTVRAMRHNIDQITDDFRNNEHVKIQFLSILQQDNKVASVLNQMNRLGILARYLPVFGRIVGRMQFDLFHIYTVDQHSLFTLRNLCLLRHGKTKVKRAEQVFANIPKPYLVYLSALFHDIAKGREGHHAELGAVDAQEFCTHFNITGDDAELIVWLVREHLVMSETAQKKDLSDPEVIAEFANHVGSLLKLRALYLLTIADISATDPKLWNDFKGSLLYELFVKTKAHLTQNIQKQSATQTKATLLEHFIESEFDKDQIKQQINNFPSNLYRRFNLSKLIHIHQLIASEVKPVVAQLNQKGESVEFLIYAHDFNGLFYIMVSLFEKHNFSVVDANINITKDGFALNIVHCIVDKYSSNSQVVGQMREALAQEKIIDIELNKYTPSREKLFKIKSKVNTLESNNSKESTIEVICRDRHGLLSLIAKALIELNISINAAKIFTIGARAENTFWINRNNKALDTLELDQLKKTLLDLL